MEVKKQYGNMHKIKEKKTNISGYTVTVYNLLSVDLEGHREVWALESAIAQKEPISGYQ